MGDPRRLKSKYSGPGHPWQSARIEEERKIINEYGLKTKRELWKASSMLKAFANQAKRLFALRTKQAELETKQLLERLSRLGLLPSGSKLDDVLALHVRNLLDRRLQSVLVTKGFARTHKQARQFIVHGHVMIGKRKLSAPSYIVPVAEEGMLVFVEKSSLFNPEHPERVSVPVKKEKVEEKKEERPPRKVVRRVKKSRPKPAKKEAAESKK
jgi:small subunit ribosomal protein S4